MGTRCRLSGISDFGIPQKERDPDKINHALPIQLQRCFTLGRGDLVVRSQLRSQRAPDSKPGSALEPPCIRAWYSPNLPSWVEYPSIGVVRKFGEGVSAQV
ncbi:hypothetical protein AVEN_240224-1 [Araneus ventricosus]|uniref:Uncharacterized protein n=1 Tax=Araneus ventricosus TaxID=182803 RepID=A0A4Y2K3Z5_ARAVE|nr:hypothetical protein AVEN_240224-1 [Araneus ventricosus]